MAYLQEENLSVHCYDIASTINKFSVDHQEDIYLSQLLYPSNRSELTDYASEKGKELSEPLEVHSFDLRTICSSDTTKKYFEILIKDSGTLHGLAYWFTLEYGWNIVVSNYYRDLAVNGNEQSNLNKQAVITFKSPISVEKEQKLKFAFLYSEGLIDFVIPNEEL